MSSQISEQRTVYHGPVELSTQGFGDPSDPALLLIMGATASMLWWPDQFCEVLADCGVFVIRYDNRDTGKSTTGPSGTPGYTTDDMAEDAVAVLDGYRVTKAHIVGMSLGGMIAQLVALKSPERVLSLTAISSSAFDEHGDDLPPMSPSFTAHFAKLETLDWKDRDAVVAFQVESARLSSNGDDRFDEADATTRGEQEFDRARNPRSAMNHAQLTGGEAWVGRLGQISVPALVIHGAKDPILSLEAGRRLAAGLPDARLVVLESGHELNRAEWRPVIAAITALTRRASIAL